MPRRDQHAEVNLAGLPRVGETLDGKYRIDGLLGVGGMGVVFGATHLRLGQRVAIKMLLPQWTNDATVAQRFAREGRASVAIRSEHTVRVVDVDESQGRPYLVLEYLLGRDLEDIVSVDGPLPISTAVDLLLQACEALAEAHSTGVIHRDLKPANLFLTHRADGSPCLKVLDFGISKVATRTSIIKGEGTLPLTVMGSPHYMSPEQMQSSTDVDVRTDIWSLGAILHELLAGRPPFDGDSITALCARVMAEPPPPLTSLRSDVAPALEGVVLRCLEKDRERRYSNVAELARALAGFGSESARESTARISRVLEGGIDVRPAANRVPSSADDAFAPRRNARALVSDPSVPAGIKSPIAGFALAAAVVLALVGAATWKILAQASAIRASERPAATAALVTTSAPSAAPPAPPFPPPPPAASGETTSAQVSALKPPPPPAVATSVQITAAQVPAPTPPPPPAASPPPPRPVVVAPAPAPAPAPAAEPPPRPHRPHHRAAPRSAPPADPDNPFDSASAPAATPPPPPAPAPAAPAPSAPSPDPNELFETRK